MRSCDLISSSSMMLNSAFGDHLQFRCALGRAGPGIFCSSRTPVEALNLINDRTARPGPAEWPLRNSTANALAPNHHTYMINEPVITRVP